jgi:hypothetical protein
VIQFFFFEIFKERVKNTRTNERKRGVFFIEKKKKKKEESKFFTRELFLVKKSLCVSVSLFVSFESESEREKERVERGWSKGTSKGPVRSFVLSRRLSKGGAVLVSKAFESQVLTLFPSSFFSLSLD